MIQALEPRANQEKVLLLPRLRAGHHQVNRQVSGSAVWHEVQPVRSIRHIRQPQGYTGVGCAADGTTTGQGVARNKQTLCIGGVGVNRLQALTRVNIAVYWRF